MIKNLALYYRTFNLYRKASRYLTAPPHDDGVRDYGVSADALRTVTLENCSLYAQERRIFGMYRNNNGYVPTTPREYLSPQPFDDGSEDLGISGDLLRYSGLMLEKLSRVEEYMNMFPPNRLMTD